MMFRIVDESRASAGMVGTESVLMVACEVLEMKLVVIVTVESGGEV